LSTLAGVSIAIVDDHRIVAQALQLLVGTRGATSEVFSSGRDLLNRLPDATWDVILLDLSMPGMSGLEVMEELNSRKCPTAVLVVSMHDKPMYMRRALDLGAAGYIRKDAPAEQLLEAISDVAAGRTALTPDVMNSLNWRRRTAAYPSKAQLSVLRHVLLGLRAREIAAALGISKRTVESHKASLMQFYQVRTTPGLIRCAQEDGLCLPSDWRL